MIQIDKRRDALALGPDDPPIDFGREQAAYARERERLVREHRDGIALIHGDDVVGVFTSADEAVLEGFRRFGADQILLKEIRDPDSADFVAHVDIHHPSFKRIP